MADTTNEGIKLGAADEAWIGKMAKSCDVEENEVRELLEKNLLKEAKKWPAKSEKFVMARAKSDTNIALKGGGAQETYTGWLQGPSGPAKDWSARDIDLIQAKAKDGGPKVVEQMAKDGEIAWVEEIIEKDGAMTPKTVAITNLQKRMVKKQGGGFKVPMWLDKEHTKKAYDIWKQGDPVVPLDTRDYLQDGETENWHQGAEMTHSYTLPLLSLVFGGKGEQKVPHLMTTTVYGDFADEDSDEYIEKHIKYMEPVKIKVTPNAKKSTNEMWQSKITKSYSIKPLDTKINIVDEIMENWAGFIEYTGDPFDEEYKWDEAMIKILDKKKNEFVDKTLAKIKKEDGWLDKYQIIRYPLAQVSIADLREWHFKYQMTDEDGNSITRKRRDSEEEYNAANRNRYAIMECTITPTEEPEEGNSIRVVVRDASDPDVAMSAFLPSSIRELPFAGPADVYLIFNTKLATMNAGTRESPKYVPKKYDREASEDVQVDEKEADITMNVVNFVLIAVQEGDEDDDAPPAKKETKVKDEDEEQEEPEV